MKIIYLLLAFISLALGSVGIVLPILPTTPFLLIAAFCFAKSSDRLHKWFQNTNLYKNNLDSFVKGHGMTRKTKCRILTTVTLLLAIGAYCMRGLTYGFLIIAVVWLAHLIGFGFFVKTKKEISCD